LFQHAKYAFVARVSGCKLQKEARSYNATSFLEAFMRRYLLFVLLVAGTVLAQDSAQRVMVNTVSVGADGKFEAEPDTAVIGFTIATQEASTQEAYDKASKAGEQVRQALKANGIDPKAAEFSSYSLQPMYDYRSPKRKITGYRVQSTVTLKLKEKDFAKSGALLQAFSGIEQTENQSLSYTLENIDVAKQKAIEDAFNKAKTSAQTVARAGGRQLGDLAYASVDTFEQQPPVPIYAARMQTMAAEGAVAKAAPSEGFTPNKITITAHVNTLFNLK
jgi:uncharacterized protein YggE